MSIFKCSLNENVIEVRKVEEFNLLFTIEFIDHTPIDIKLKNNNILDCKYKKEKGEVTYTSWDLFKLNSRLTLKKDSPLFYEYKEGEGKITTN